MKNRLSLEHRSLPYDAIELAQNILGQHDLAPGTSLIDAIDNIVSNKTWSRRLSSSRTPYASFGYFGIDPQPQGLGIHTKSQFRLVRFSLLNKRHYRELASLIECSVRSQGRPSEILVGDEKLCIIVSTSRNSLDRILLTLARDHVESFEAVCRGDLTPREAARRLSLLPSAQRREFGACDIAAASNLRAAVQDARSAPVVLLAAALRHARRRARIPPQDTQQWRPEIAMEGAFQK